jgi:hypothetical protein
MSNNQKILETIKNDSKLRSLLDYALGVKRLNAPIKLLILERFDNFVALKDVLVIYTDYKWGLKSANIDECPACECDPCDCYEWSGGVP